MLFFLFNETLSWMQFFGGLAILMDAVLIIVQQGRIGKPVEESVFVD